jgi:glycosyltransferase involved in cell wall biosynthesis
MKPKISFMMRIHNEEKTLKQSIESLKQLSFQYEIILVLHNCTDESENIANFLKDESINLFKYEHQLSRAGYENLCTNVDSVHSIPYYYNWCLNKCNSKWIFKWDGDFIMTSKLAEFLNCNLDQFSNTAFRIHAVNSTSSNAELYLTDSLIEYSKYMFWEVPNFSLSNEVKLTSEQNIIHDSEIENMKQYWVKQPWFYTDESEEAKQIKNRYEMLVSEFGEEPKGLARASNPQCDEILFKIAHNKPSYIDFFK